MTTRPVPDWGLRVRMVGALVLLGAGNLAFVALVVRLLQLFPEPSLVDAYVIGPLRYVSPPLAASVDAALLGFWRSNAWLSPVIVPVTALFVLAQYGFVRRRPLRSTALSGISLDPDPGLVARVQRLAQQADVPQPTVEVTLTNTANCYTVGRQGDATIVVSNRLLDVLDDDELDAVLAHELAHIANRDVTVMTLAVVPFELARLLGRTLDRTATRAYHAMMTVATVGVLGITLVAFVVLLTRLFEGGYDLLTGAIPGVSPGPLFPWLADPESLIGLAAGGLVQVTTTITVPLFWVALLSLPPLVGMTVYYVVLGPIPRHFSRYREYAADRAAARLIGNPAALASALETLDKDRPTTDLRHAHAVDALCFFPGGFDDPADPTPIRAWVATAFPRIEATLQRVPVGVVAHPDTRDRVTRLRDLVE